MRFLIAPDKFKGTLDAWEVACALENGFRSVLPDMEARLLPIADGGEGTAKTIGLALGARFEELETVDALGRSCKARVGIYGDLALFDMASAAGLTQIEPALRDPWKASTRGIGILLKKLEQQGLTRIWIGLGGSATNDAGVGMAAALGYRFLDGAGQEVDPLPCFFTQIKTIVPPSPLSQIKVTGLCDVTNRLLGKEGASHVYGPQKGLPNPEAMDAVLSHLADCLAAALGRDDRDKPRAGAAGGLGYGLSMFCGAVLADGFQSIAEILRLEEAVKTADVVITGEGCLDSQTLSGKGPMGVAEMACRHGRLVHAFCGLCRLDPGQNRHPFHAIHPLVDGMTTLQESSTQAGFYLEKKAAQIAFNYFWHRQMT